MKNNLKDCPSCYASCQPAAAALRAAGLRCRQVALYTPWRCPINNSWLSSYSHRPLDRSVSRPACAGTFVRGISRVRVSSTCIPKVLRVRSSFILRHRIPDVKPSGVASLYSHSSGVGGVSGSKRVLSRSGTKTGSSQDPRLPQGLHRIRHQNKVLTRSGTKTGSSQDPKTNMGPLKIYHST